MPLRKLVDHLEYRTQVWRFAIRVLREVHNQRFPGGRNFGRDLDLVVAYGFAFISFSKHGRVRLSTYLNSLGCRSKRRGANSINWSSLDCYGVTDAILGSARRL